MFKLPYRDDKAKLVPMILVITTKTMYFFEDYKKTCTKCPVEAVCWTPKLLEEPIPLENVKSIIETNLSQLFGLEVEQTVREFLVFKKQKIQHKFFYMNNSQSKEKMLSILSEFNEEIIKLVDPIADSFVKSQSLKGAHSMVHTQIVKMQEFEEKKIDDLALLCVVNNNVSIFKLSIDAWEWIPELEQDQKNTLLSPQERERLKTAHETKEVLVYFNL